MTKKVLLIDDSIDVFELVKKALSNTSIQIFYAMDAKQARRQFARNIFDLILIDIGLPDIDGIKLCEEIQADQAIQNTPIFFITARHESDIKVLAFNSGADDYIEKPFDLKEFRARIEAKLKKQNKPKNDFLVFGDLEINIVDHKVYMKQNNSKSELPLTPIEFKLLSLFARSPEKTFSRKNVLETIWGNVNVYDRTIDTHIYSLRKKLNHYNACVESITGIGYRFNPGKITQNAV